MTSCVREVIAKAAGCFENGIEAAVFTTFTFDPRFFEANVLPTLFNVETRNVEARHAGVNARLADVPVAVFYDAAAQPSGGGDVRYQTWAVRLPGAGENGRKGPYFHAKLTLLAGRYREGDETYPAIYVNCGSANLTLSGWGRNLEALAETWIDDADSPAYGVLRQFLTWLRAERLPGGAQCEALNQALGVLEEIEPYGGDGPELHITGIARGTPTLAHQLRKGHQRAWDTLTVLSPYWSGPETLPELLKSFNVKTVNLAPGTNGEGCYGLTPAHLEALTGHAVTTCALDGIEPGRFAHAKLYALTKEHGNHLRVAVGSCNMTGAAHQTSGANVEAMLIHSLDLKKDAKRALPALRTLDLSDAPLTGEMDEPLDGVPFDLTVVFDWRSKEYVLWFSGPPAGCAGVALCLPAIATLLLGGPCENRRIACPGGPGKERGYRGTWTLKGDEVTINGLFSEINLDHSTRDYTPRLSASEIVDSLRDHSLGLDRCLERNRLFDDDGDLSDAPPPQMQVFNLYDFYAVMQHKSVVLTATAESCQERTRRVADLVGRPSSLLKLTQAVTTDGSPPVHRFAVALEVHRLMQANASLLDPEHLSAIAGLLNQARADVTAEVVGDAGSGFKASPVELVAWFETELNACGD